MQEHGDLFGKALEQLIFLELRTYIDYEARGAELHYWRSLSRFEINGEIAIEVKGS